MDASSHHFCVNGQGGAIEYKFPLIGRLQIHHLTHSLDTLSETTSYASNLTRVRLHCLLASASCTLAALHMQFMRDLGEEEVSEGVMRSDENEQTQSLSCHITTKNAGKLPRL